MQEILENLASNMIDFLIYAVTAAVAIVGLIKCVFPMNKIARKLRKAIRRLETTAGEVRPVWQDVQFLGKEMQPSWRRFLMNAEQLNARGLNCDVEDYVNDDTAIYPFNHAQLAEVIPGLLTSLGILGTFIGLVRALSGLDMSDAANTISSIPQMISGMAFAFSTSLVGVSCSLVFQICQKTALGRATHAVDDFNEAFSELVMQRPLDNSVQLICEQEDRSAILRHLSTDVSSRVSEGIIASVEKTLSPVAQSMNSFILGQTQAQIDGVNRLVNQFIAQMNHSLSGQFTQLGQTLSMISQAQSVSYDTIDRTLAASGQILSSLSHVQDVTQQVMQHFEGYVTTLEKSQENSSAFLTHGSQVLSGLMASSQEQQAFLGSLKSAQQELQTAMKDYASFSSSVIGAVEEKAHRTSSATEKAAKKMDESSRLLSDSYAHFVDNISGGFSRALGLFDENIHSVLQALTEKLNEKRALAEKGGSLTNYQKEAEGCAAALSRLQRALADITEEISGKAGGSEA